MKKYRTTIVALILIAVVLGGFFLCRHFGLIGTPEEPVPTDEYADVETGSPYTLATETDLIKDVTTIVCRSEGEVLELQKKSGTWTCVTDTNLEVGSKTVSQMFSVIRSSLGRIVLDLGDKFLTDAQKAEFGFDEGCDYSQLILSDGTSYRVYFGAYNTTGSSVYAWEEGSHKVYLLDKSMIKSLVLTPINLISSRVFAFSDSGQINKIVIYKNDEKILQLNAVFSGDEKAVRDWRMVAPLERNGNVSAIESLVSTLSSLTITDVVKLNATQEELASYGLSPASYRVCLTDPSGTVVLSLGNKTEDGTYYYVRTDDTNDIFTLAASSVNFKDESAISYLDKYVKMIYYTNLSHVTLSVLGKTYELTYTFGDGNDETFTFNGHNCYLSEEKDYRGDFKRVGTAMYNLRLAALEDEPEHPGEELCKITYTENDGTVTVVKCLARDEGTMYFYINDKYVGGYGNRYLLTAGNTDYGIQGTVANLLEKLGVTE